MIRNSYIVVFSVMLAALFSLNCGKRNTSEINSFNMNFYTGLETLDPVMSNAPASIWVLNQVMETLVQYDKSNNLVPALASSYEISDDALVYTFHLRRGIKYQNDLCIPQGRTLNASDVKYCLERVNNPSSKTRGLWVFRDKIKGAEDYSLKKANSIEGLQVLNDSTIRIILVKPFAPFLSLLTMSYALIYPPEAVAYYGENFGFHPVGTGPFKFVRWEIDKELILSKNENYYQTDSLGKSLPYLDNIKISFKQSTESEYLDFLNGDFDYHEPTFEMLQALTDENGNLLSPEKRDFTLVRQPWLNTVYLIILQDTSLPGGKSSPFVNHRNLRKAINFSVNRDKIVKYILRGRGIPATNGPLPIGLPGYSEDTKGYSYNPDSAKFYFRKAGYPDGKGLNLTLFISNDELQKSLAIALQNQLADFGVQMNIEQVMQSVLNSQQQYGELSFTRGNWGADYYDPENFMALFYSKNIIPFGPNKTGYRTPLADSLYELAMRIKDFDIRAKLYNEMEKIVIDDAAWAILYYNVRFYLLKKNISGFYLDGLNNIVLKYTSKN